MGNFHGKALIIDNNFKFLDEIRKLEDLQASYPCIISKTFPEAAIILKNNNHQIRVVFISSNISSSHALNELKEIRQIRPQIPVFLVSHQPSREPPEISAPETGFLKMIPAPENYIPLVKEMDALFRNQETWTDIVATQEEKNVELKLAEEAYIPTRISDFIITPKSYFNVYIRIGASTFIKILNAGDSLELDTIHSYVKKGVTHFFISAEEQRKYIRLCEELSQNIVRRSDVALTKKAKSVLKLGASISQNIMHTGITDEKLDFANNFMNQTVTLIKSMRMQNSSLKKFLESIEMKEHPSSVSFLAGIIANEAGFESLKSVKLVGVAALVHDIGLFDLDPNFTHEGLYSMTEEKQALFDKHEKHGGEILRNNGGFEEVICQAVEQHHMRRRGNDPARRTNNINLVTEIVGAADELHNLISSDDFTPDKMRLFIENTLPDFSPQIEKAVVKLLNKKSAA